MKSIALLWNREMRPLSIIACLVLEHKGKSRSSALIGNSDWTGSWGDLGGVWHLALPFDEYFRKFWYPHLQWFQHSTDNCGKIHVRIILGHPIGPWTVPTLFPRPYNRRFLAVSVENVPTQWNEVWSSIVIFSLGYFCLRCAKIDYVRSQVWLRSWSILTTFVVNFDYDYTDFTLRREKWDLGNTRTKNGKDVLAPHERRRNL